MISKEIHTTPENYIESFSPQVREILEKIRAVIRSAAPDAQEKMSYGAPTFTLSGKNLVHFAAHANHIGFYPTPSAIEKFEGELAPYHYAKGSVQFPLSEPMPYELIRRMVEFRVQEQAAKNSDKSKK